MQQLPPDPLKIDATPPLFVSNVTPEGFSIAYDGTADQIYGTTTDQSYWPGAILAIPTCLGSGPPTWVPPPGVYGIPWWSNPDGELWVWDGTKWVPIGGSSDIGRAWEHYRHISAPRDGKFYPKAASRKRWHPVAVHTDTGYIYDSVVPDQIFAEPWISPVTATVKKIAVEVTLNTPNTGSFESKVLMAIYETDSGFGQVSRYPTTRLFLSEEIIVNYSISGSQQIRFTKDYDGADMAFVLDTAKCYWFVFNRETFAIPPGPSFDWTMTSLGGGNAADVLGCEIDPDDSKFTFPATHIIKPQTYLTDSTTPSELRTSPDFALPDPFPDDGKAVANDGSVHHLTFFLWYAKTGEDLSLDP